MNVIGNVRREFRRKEARDSVGNAKGILQEMRDCDWLADVLM